MEKFSTINLVNGKEMAVDSTVASEAIAGLCSWKVFLKDSTLGSDHYPIFIEIGIRNEINESNGSER